MPSCKRCKAVKSDEKMAAKTNFNICISCLNSSKWRGRQNKKYSIKPVEARRLVLSHYGTTCACCGESEQAFLEIDHINNNGADHRREIGRMDICVWIVENNYPEGMFQILCANCNHGKYRAGGVCPHEKARYRQEKWMAAVATEIVEYP